MGNNWIKVIRKDKNSGRKRIVCYHKSERFREHIYTITDKYPKKFRFTLVSKLQNLSIAVIENLYRANIVYVMGSNDTARIEKRKGYQKEAYVSLKLFNYFAWMAREQQCILPKQFEQIAKQSTGVSQMLLGWLKSDKKKYESVIMQQMSTTTHPVSRCEGETLKIKIAA